MENKIQFVFVFHFDEGIEKRINIINITLCLFSEVWLTCYPRASS